MRRGNGTRQGFSLIELLIVVGIMMILASIIGVSVLSHLGKAHRSDAEATILKLTLGLERYKSEKFRYPRTEDLVEAMQSLDKSGQEFCHLEPSEVGTTQVVANPIRIIDGSGGTTLLQWNKMGRKYVVGPYNLPIVYVPKYQYRSHPLLVSWNDENCNNMADANETYYNPAGFQIWWAGEDMMVRGITDQSESFHPCLSPYNDRRDNDRDGLTDLDDNMSSSRDKPAPKNTAEDDVISGL